jgi:hypothetical protein
VLAENKAPSLSIPSYYFSKKNKKLVSKYFNFLNFLDYINNFLLLFKKKLTTNIYFFLKKKIHTNSFYFILNSVTSYFQKKKKKKKNLNDDYQTKPSLI